MVRHFVSSNQKFGEAESLLNQINVLRMNGIRSKIPVIFLLQNEVYRDIESTLTKGFAFCN